MAWNHINDKFVQRYCVVEGCDARYRSRGYCFAHWQRWRKYGYVPSFNFRTPNRVIVRGSFAEVIIYKGFTDEVLAVSKIDIDDVQRVSEYKWHLASGYVKNNKWPLASFIMGGQKWVDHISGDRLDNRKSNLRVVNNAQNSQNTGVQKRLKSSRYEGVHWDDVLPVRKWRASIKPDGKTISLGRYKTQEEAAWMYDQYALELFGEYARTNFHYPVLSPIQTLGF